MQEILPGAELSEALMMAGLAATYPDLEIRPLRDFGSQWVDKTGVWTGGGEAVMPDGCPIFNDLTSSDSEGNYDGFVHTGFLAWLGRRGWGYEHYDGATFLLVPMSHFDPPSVVGTDGRKYLIEGYEDPITGEPFVRILVDSGSVDVPVAFLANPYRLKYEQTVQWCDGYVGAIDHDVLAPFARGIAEGIASTARPRGRFEMAWVPDSGEPHPLDAYFA